MQNQNDRDIYTDVFYFVTVTLSTVGYGDYSPQTRHEKWICIVLITVGAFVYAFIIGSFSGACEFDNFLLVTMFGVLIFGVHRSDDRQSHER